MPTHPYMTIAKLILQPADRRVVLVTNSKPSELLISTILTNLDAKTYAAAQLVQLYQKRGKAEKHQGEAQGGLLHGAVIGRTSESARRQ